MKQIKTFILLCCVFPINAADNPAFININVGQIGVADETSQPRLGLEYRHTNLINWDLIPSVGLVLNKNHSKYIYAQVLHNFHPGRKWILSPLFGVTLFDNNHDIDLGNTIEFRSGLELSYKLDNLYQIGITAYHLSNGGMSSSNPGTESVVVSLNIPL